MEYILDLVYRHVHLVYAGVVQHVGVGGQVVGQVGAVPRLYGCTLAWNIPVCPTKCINMRRTIVTTYLSDIVIVYSVLKRECQYGI